MLNMDKSKKLNTEGMKYLFNATPYVEPVMDHGKGSFVWDVDGNRYLDLNSGQFCLCFGHSYDPLIAVVSEQIKRIYHTNTATLTPEVYKAAKDMATIAGGDLHKTIFLSTGSEANECALRYAQFATKRSLVACIDYGYHGLTLGSQGVTMGGKWAMPHIDRFISVSTPDYYHYEGGLSENEYVEEKIAELQLFFEENGDSLAAFILEPVIGVGGMVAIPHSYLKMIRKLCDKYGVMLIFDECQCGFGRSGEWFVYQQAEVYPDILTTAKAMGMGLAVSAVTFSDKMIDLIDGKLTHFSSHQNDPLSAVVVSFVINEIRDKDLLRKNKQNGEYLLSCITEICDKVDFLKNPRGIGLMCAFDIDDAMIPEYRQFSGRFIRQLLQNGILIQAIRQGRTFRIMPNYLTNIDEMQFLRDMVVKAAKEVG